MICNIYRMPVNRGQSQQQGLKIEKKEEMSKGPRSVLPANFPDMFTSVFAVVCPVKTFPESESIA